MRTIKIKDFFIGKDHPLVVVSGPCVIESEEQALDTARTLKEIFDRFGIHFIFKSSYDKANRSALDSFRGPGLKQGLAILKRIRDELDLPIFTDVHTPEEAEKAGAVCDIIQIPAFLCRQTDLLLAAGRSGATVNIKKGQFLSPWDMGNVVEKVLSTGNDKILLTERGTSFGYNNLVSDMRSIPILQQLGFPVLFDATHSVQMPGALGKQTGGKREFVGTLARAALAAGANGIYAEAHAAPEQALSDSASMLSFEMLESELEIWRQLHEVVHGCVACSL